MANIVINAAVTKAYADKASGIASALRGKSLIGLLDVRPVQYSNKTRHIAGLKYDKNKRIFYLTSPKKADDVNLGIFISTYDVKPVEGKVLAREELNDVYELPSVAAKFELGGYDDVIKNSGETRPEVHPRKVNLVITVITAPDRAIVRNSAGFNFVCDFKNGKWYTMRPGETKARLYTLKDDELLKESVFRESLPFPALDRNLYDDSSMLEFDKFDYKNHVIKNV